MNRFDRVSAILILLQSRHNITAAEMAQRFEVSLRTIYRDIATLEQAGIPICAEPGTGFSLAQGYHLPPVMFTSDEAATLLLAEKMMTKLSDKSAQANFKSSFDKIRTVLPSHTQAMIENLEETIEVYPSRGSDADNHQFLTTIQQALARGMTLMIRYDAFYNNHPVQEREVEPIGLCFYSMHWHLIAWCRLRNDYRDFRIDRILTLCITGHASNTGRRISLKEYFLSLTQKGELRPIHLTVTQRTATVMESAAQYYGFLESSPAGDNVDMLFVTADESWMARWLMMYLDGIVHIESSIVKDEINRLIASKNF